MLSNTHFSMAVHVLSALACNEGRVVGSEDLAKTVGTNPSFLRGLIGQLRDAGLVETRLGKGGGAILSRSAPKITLRDVFLATETMPAIKVHPCDQKSPCPVARGMNEAMASLNTSLQGVMESELKKITLADLVKKHMTELA